VGQPTLTRFFALHFLLPMIIIILIIVHLTTLHQNGSSNPTGRQRQIEKTNFHPYFSSKDTPPIIIRMMVVYTIITQWPLILGDNENSNEANPLTTPLHIQPEWYFLFAYAILRAIPSKLGGVIALAASLLVFLAPTTKKSKQNQTKNRPLQKTLILSLLGSLVILTWIGANPVEPPYEIVGQISSILYFLIIATVCIN
jgi:ubiquinol-cytochrome c reductase cytochrome b subunit